MLRFLTNVAILAVMLLGLPISGAMVCGLPLQRYLEFPPRTLYVSHAPFSLGVFTAYVVFVLLVVTPFLRRAFSQAVRTESAKRGPSYSFPWWGWIGISIGLITWILAWNRFSWFKDFQAHTFTPLWVSLILAVNGLTYRRTGNCLLLDKTIPYLLLFPASAIFWWFFEYLNRFVQNWYYVGPPMSPREYFWYATLAFSTVLPAFAAVREWILTFSWPDKFRGFFPISLFRPKTVAGLVLTVSGLGLLLLGIYPDYLFSLLWISPLLILVSLKTLWDEPHLFSSLSEGRWDLLVVSALSALICGFFWEMWNFYSLAKWIYQVPFVARFRIFEMPVIGYAGYLPFGLECAVIVEMVMNEAGYKIQDTGYRIQERTEVKKRRSLAK